MERAAKLFSTTLASHSCAAPILLCFACVLLFMGKAQSQTAVMLKSDILYKSATPLKPNSDSAADYKKKEIVTLQTLACFDPDIHRDSMTALNLKNCQTDKLISCQPELVEGGLSELTFQPDDTKKHQLKQRTKIMTGVHIVGYGGTLAILNGAWYKNYPRSSFHSFNDSKEWLQVDKIGHGWTSYNISRVSTSLWRWTGIDDKKAVMYGAIGGAGYQTAIEIMDGFSSEWGWSWADIGANFFGSGLYMAQELKWKEQRIQYKFSFHKKKYADATLAKRANNLFGSSWHERMLKDYNGQTYWLCFNIKSFLPQSKLPAWLNVSVGYGAEGMLGGFENRWTDGDTGFPINRSDVKRNRQWYLAPDIDLSKIKTNKKGVKILLNFLNAFKFPMPAVELSGGKLRVKGVVF